MNQETTVAQKIRRYVTGHNDQGKSVSRVLTRKGKPPAIVLRNYSRRVNFS